MKNFFVYIMTNKHHTVLYTGVTAFIENRGPQHKFKMFESFTKRYNVSKMVYARYYPLALEAIAMEKRIKGWSRAKKITLINSVNPEWKDLMNEQGEVNLDVLKDGGFGKDVLWSSTPARIKGRRGGKRGSSHS